jgi:hypothetical protein
MYKDSVIKIGFSNDKVPMFVETKGKDFIKYGETNNYPEYLVTLFNRSAKHNAIITSKQLYINGQGFVFDQTDMDGKDVLSLQAFIDNPNPYETLNDLMSKTNLDCELFGGCYLKIVGRKGGKGYDIYHVDYCKLRSNYDNSEFYYSNEWMDENGQEKHNPDIEYTYPPFDPNAKKQAESIYYYKSYRPNLNTYTLPEYIGAVPAIITDAEIANFHRAEIQNGFKGSKMITFMNGVPSDDEMKVTERKLKNKFTSTDSAGSIVIDFVDDPARAAKIEDLNAGDFADKYQALNETIQQEIFVGHKITSPMIFGVRVEGQLGGRSEMIDAYNIFSATYISPKQRVQTNIYNLFSPIKGKLEIKPLEPIMPNFSEQTLMNILTKDEMRDIVGRKPLEIKNVISNVADSLSALSPLVATKVLNQLTPNEVRAIIGKAGLEGGDLLAPSSDVAAPGAFSNDRMCNHDFTSAQDNLDLEVFMKYGEPAENFVSLKRKKTMMSSQDFALTDGEKGVLDLIKKTPDISKEDIAKILKISVDRVEGLIETLIGDKLIVDNKGVLNITTKGDATKLPSFDELLIRYKYEKRDSAPPLSEGGSSREFCQAMMSNDRYYTREDIINIGNDLGQLYGIPNYDAFTRRGGWYHDPLKNVNLPYCRHIWVQSIVKKIK